MSRPIDERFLTVHPRTALWWQQREQCQQCAHYHEKVVGARTNETSRVMHCSASPTRIRVNARVDHQSCISMRDDTSACGPGAVLFTPITKG